MPVRIRSAHDIEGWNPKHQEQILAALAEQQAATRPAVKPTPASAPTPKPTKPAAPPAPERPVVTAITWATVAAALEVFLAAFLLIFIKHGAGMGRRRRGRR